MRRWNTLLKFLTALVLALVVWIVGWFTVESPGLVNWGELRAVALESDDWGLAGFVPSAKVWQGHTREDLNPGNFPPVYWESTLESAEMVSGLASVMSSVRDQDGLPAVFQPNYVMSSLAYEKQDQEFVWQRYDLPHFPEAYARPAMWDEVNLAVARGLWYPEFHATWHYDPALRLSAALSTDLAREMTEAGVTLFPGSEVARELGPWRSLADLEGELQASMAIFQKVFDRPIGSVIAPDYTWDSRLEDLWQKLGVTVIQGKREQRDPSLKGGKLGRVQKYLLRKTALIQNRQRQYLERNCRLEPVQAPDPAEVVQKCVADSRLAWQKGQPAIVETHRVNFAHDDPAVVQQGQNSLQDYLNSICNDPENLPRFMVDTEIAQLKARGVSWVRRGNTLVLRNGSHSRRLLWVPEDPTRSEGDGRWFGLAPQSTFVIPW